MKIVISVEGGVVQQVCGPPGLEVEVFDWDNISGEDHEYAEAKEVEYNEKTQDLKVVY